MRLHLHAWGEVGAPRLVCLHGVTAHGLRFRKLAEERLAARFRVLAPDLRGHGRSGWEPPWDGATQLADVTETVGPEPATWLGHSYGGRLALELAARQPERVKALVLLDPAIRLLPHVALDLAEQERKEAVFASPAEAIQARLDSGRVLHTPLELLEEDVRDHLEPARGGGLRHRYCKSAVVSAFGEMAGPPPPVALVPTLLVLGAQSWLLLDDHLERLRDALGDLLQVVEVPGGHTVLWDAFPASAGAIEQFLRS